MWIDYPGQHKAWQVQENECHSRFLLLYAPHLHKPTTNLKLAKQEGVCSHRNFTSQKHQWPIAEFNKAIDDSYSFSLQCSDGYSGQVHVATTCINNRGTIPSSENIRLLECDLPWNINVKQMHLNTMMSKPTFRKTCHSWSNCEVKWPLSLQKTNGKQNEKELSTGRCKKPCGALPWALHLCQKHSTYCIGGHCCAQVWNLQRLSISSHVPRLTALQKKGMLQTQHQCPQHRLGSCHLNKDSSKSPEKKNQTVWWRIKCIKEFWFQLPCLFVLKLCSKL